MYSSINSHFEVYNFYGFCCVLVRNRIASNHWPCTSFLRGYPIWPILLCRQDYPQRISQSIFTWSPNLTALNLDQKLYFSFCSSKMALDLLGHRMCLINSNKGLDQESLHWMPQKNKRGLEWSNNASEYKPSDFFPWGYLEDNFYHNEL